MTTGNLSFHEGVQVAWDATSITLAMECPRKYQYRMLWNLQPKTSSVHLIFGGIFASSLEKYYQAEGDHDAKILVAVRHALEKSWDAETGAPMEFHDSNKTHFNLIRSIVWYLDHYEQSGEAAPLPTFIMQNGKPAVELYFAVDYSRDVVFTGHIDRVVEFAGGLYWIDQKTTRKTINHYFFKSYSFANQTLLYTWVGPHIISRPIAGGIIDGVQVNVHSTQFQRSPIPIFPGLLDEWAGSALDTIHRTQDLTTKGGLLPGNHTACGNYNGCPYRNLCEANPRMRELEMKDNYLVSKPWDPVARTGADD